MAELVLDAFAAALVAAVLYTSYRTVLVVLVGVVLLIPSSLVVPHLHSSSVTVDHAVLLAAGLRVVADRRRDRLPRTAFALTPLHGAFGIAAATWATTGVLLAPTLLTGGDGGRRLADLGFLALLLVVVLALLRELDRPLLAPTVIGTTLTIAAGIAVLEHITGTSFGKLLFDAAGQSGSTLAAAPLETRGFALRVRSSAEFALSFSWVAVMALPMLTVLAVRGRGALLRWGPAVALAVAAVYWTYSRSSLAAVPALLAVVALGSRDRRLLATGGLLAAAGVLAYLASPTLQHHLSLAADQGAVDVRFERLPPVLTAVAAHAWTGLGFGGLKAGGFPTTDDSYVFAYAETGALGAVALAGLLGCALLQAVRGLLLRDATRRAVAAAALAGLVAFCLAGGFEDAFFVTQPAQLFVVLLAVATAVAEPERGVVRLPTPSLRRVAGGALVGAVVGAVAFLVAPRPVSQERQFYTVPVSRQVGFYDTVVEAHALIRATCDLAHDAVASTPGTRVDCRDDFTAAGLGTLRVEAPSAPAVDAAYADISRSVTAVSYLSAFQTAALGPAVRARATPWRTAPGTGALAGLVVALLLPVARRRAPVRTGRPQPVASDASLADRATAGV